MAFDSVIANGMVVDGTGAPAYRADVGVSAGVISAIGPLAEAEAAWRIDASDKVVSPGFIDLHSHSDISVIDDPGNESKVHQGVTTEVIGNCGMSPFPVVGAVSPDLKQPLNLPHVSPIEWDWTDFDGWARRVESQGCSLNVAALVGHSALRAAVGLMDDRPPADDELRSMQRFAAEMVEQGAFALSTGLTLAPSSYGSTDEIAALCRAIAPYEGSFYATHARIWAGNLIGAIEEAVEIGTRAGVPVEYSHLALIDPRLYGRGDEMVAVMERARARGLDITFDMYPYTATGPGLNQLPPAWVQEGGVEAMLHRLSDAATKARAAEETATGWYGGLPWRWDKLVISYVGSDRNEDLVGLSMAEIADRRELEPAEVLLSLIVEEEGEVSSVFEVMNDDDVRDFMSHPLATIGSDGNAISPKGIYADDRPHPRFYGTFPRVLGRYSREGRVMPLEEAVAKITSRPARRLGFDDRGAVKEGFVADLVVFDPKSVIDRATFEEPHQYPDGIDHVLVGGVSVLADGVHTGARPGRVLRRGDVSRPAS